MGAVAVGAGLIREWRFSVIRGVVVKGRCPHARMLRNAKTLVLGLSPGRRAIFIGLLRSTDYRSEARGVFLRCRFLRQSIRTIRMETAGRKLRPARPPPLGRPHTAHDQ